MMSIAPQLMDRLPEVSAYLVEEMLTEADRLDPSDNGK
jgi:hypothetical protein